MGEASNDKDFFEKVFSFSPQAMILFDSSENIIFKNKAADNLSGNIMLAPFKNSVKEIIKSDSAYKKRITYKYMDSGREKEI